jgi:hypothetical protein
LLAGVDFGLHVHQIVGDLLRAGQAGSRLKQGRDLVGAVGNLPHADAARDLELGPAQAVRDQAQIIQKLLIGGREIGNHVDCLSLDHIDGCLR